MDDIDDDEFGGSPLAPQYKGEDGFWYCGECKQQIGDHLGNCETHNAFKTWFRKITEQPTEPRPDWMCEGCDAPKNGQHRFSCYKHGKKQLTIPVVINNHGKIKVDY